MIAVAHNRISHINDAPMLECYDCIKLGPNEWNNDTMTRVAMEHFDAHPDLQYVEVREHGGWYLGYRRDGSVYCTANDRARCDGPKPTGGMRRWIKRD